MKNIKKHIGLLAGTLAITTGVYGSKGTPPAKPEPQENKKRTEVKPRQQKTNDHHNINNMSAFQHSSSIYIVETYQSSEQTTFEKLQPNQIRAPKTRVYPPTIQLCEIMMLKNKFSYIILKQKGFIISNEYFRTPFEVICEYLNNDRFENSQDLDNLKNELWILVQDLENKSTIAFKKIAKYLRKDIIIVDFRCDGFIKFFGKDRRQKQTTCSNQELKSFLDAQIINNDSIIIYLDENYFYHIVTPPNK